MYVTVGIGARGLDEVEFVTALINLLFPYVVVVSVSLFE